MERITACKEMRQTEDEEDEQHLRESKTCAFVMMPFENPSFSPFFCFTTEDTVGCDMNQHQAFVSTVSQIGFKCLWNVCCLFACLYNDSPSSILGEFLIFMRIKVLTKDFNGNNLVSPTHVAHEIWRSAILDTSFYKKLMAALAPTDQAKETFFIHHADKTTESSQFFFMKGVYTGLYPNRSIRKSNEDRTITQGPKFNWSVVPREINTYGSKPIPFHRLTVDVFPDNLRVWPELKTQFPFCFYWNDLQKTQDLVV